MMDSRIDGQSDRRAIWPGMCDHFPALLYRVPFICFADEYHWHKGIGPQRSVTLNPNWGGVTEANTFGTHEFMDFIDQIGAEAYVSVNVGSGTPQEAAEWLEYMTAAAPTTLVKERAANGHPAPYKVALLGIGNESWDCGGNMTPDYYVSQMKIYSRFVRNFNPAQQTDPKRMLKIAVGPGGDGPRWTEWTEAVMKAWKAHTEAATAAAAIAMIDAALRSGRHTTIEAQARNMRTASAAWFCHAVAGTMA